MTRKTIPYLFLAFLFATLLFIIGVRYGQRVEQTNETISYLISIPPSPTVAPTNIPLSFTDYIHKGCAISFLLPNDLEKTSESSNSAVFSTKSKKLGIALSCEKKVFVKGEKELSVSLNKSIRAYETQTKDTFSYRFYHINTGKVIIVTIAKQYLPLLQKSVSFAQ
jgi:hypothetical protein